MPSTDPWGIIQCIYIHSDTNKIKFWKKKRKAWSGHWAFPSNNLTQIHCLTYQPTKLLNSVIPCRVSTCVILPGVCVRREGEGSERAHMFHPFITWNTFYQCYHFTWHSYFLQRFFSAFLDGVTCPKFKHSSFYSPVPQNMTVFGGKSLKGVIKLKCHL